MVEGTQHENQNSCAFAFAQLFLQVVRNTSNPHHTRESTFHSQSILTPPFHTCSEKPHQPFSHSKALSLSLFFTHT